MRGTGIVSPVSNEEMKAKGGAVTCQRSHSKSKADFQWSVSSGLGSFLNHALQGEAGKEGSQEEQGCISTLEKL